MRALILCDNHGAFPPGLLERRPPCLLPLGVKPILQHMLEGLAKRGVKQVSLICGDKADFVQGFVGTGRRWGLEASHVLARGSEGVAEAIRLAAPARDERLIVVPSLTLDGCGPVLPPCAWSPEDGPLLLAWGDAEEGPQPELLFINGEQAHGLRPGASTAKEAVLDGRVVTAQGAAVLVWDLKSYWEANLKLLRGEEPFEPPSDRPGIRARVHPGAIISAPAILDEAVEVGAVCQIGPLAVVGAHSILDDGVEARECVILPGTFVGRNTSVVRAVADQGLLVSIDDGSELHVPDPFILGPASAVSLAGLAWDAAQRALALLSLMAVLPVLAVFALRRFLGANTWKTKTVVVAREVVSLSGEKRFRLARMHLANSGSPFLAGLPALWDVVTGDLALVGVAPLSPEEASALAGGWAEPRFSCKAGLISPWHAEGGEEADETQKRVMEVFYAQTRTPSSDIRILCKAAVRFFSHDLRTLKG